MSVKGFFAACLTTSNNDFQQLLLSDAVTKAKLAGYSVQGVFAEGQTTLQIKQLYGFINSPPEKRPRAILVTPVRDNSLKRVARDAVKNGIGWICLLRRVDYLLELRNEFPGIPIFSVLPDQIEIGRIQGRQFKKLLPNGGRLLYITGITGTSSADNRLKGVREVLSGSNIDLSDILDGNWTADDAERMISGWLRMVVHSSTKVDVIGCQNDQMAIGAYRALDTIAIQFKQPELRNIPITGVDGVPTVGQKLLREGKIAATVLVPSSAGPAIEMLVRQLEKGIQPPLENLISAGSLPEEKMITPKKMN